MKQYFLFIYGLLVASTLHAQQHLTGRVSDAEGNPLAGASVRYVSSGHVIVTNSDGAFSLPQPFHADTILVSYIGYVKRSLPVAAGEHGLLRIELTPDPIHPNSDFEWPEGQTPEGDSFQMELTDYNHVLVEFWASWCAPCRVQNPEWNELLSRYQDRGFHILGISLDQDTNAWQQAIDSDGLSGWLHVTDLGGFKGINALKYGIQFIPHNVLVGSDGKVIDQHLKPADLDSLLSGYY